MTVELSQKLKDLADKYEISSFKDNDPSQFLDWYNIASLNDVECCSFIAAMLSFGSRKQFIPKIRQIMEMADKNCGGISAWILAGAPGFGNGEKKFYRFYSYDDMLCLFNELSDILKTEGSVPLVKTETSLGALGLHLKKLQANNPDARLGQLLSDCFPKSKIVPKGKNSANKRVYMFLRWMVRQNSPVDIGIWNWADPAKLLIPLDVHVMQESINLGLLPANAKASLKTAIALTKEMEKVFPGDPARGDFSLFQGR